MSRVKFHTVEQPDSDITTFVISCDRLNLLEETLKSFFATNTVTTKMVIVDDSGNPEVFDKLVERYGSFSDVVCFPENRGLWWAMDFMVSYCYTPYIFYLEDDWQFFRSGYIQKSKEILEKYRDIGTVDCSFRTFEWQGMDGYDRNLVDGEFYNKKPWRITNNHLCWYGWIGSPNLRRRDDLIQLGRVEKGYNEWNIDRKFMALGYKAVFLKDKYVDHLGDNQSRMASKRPNEGTVPEDFIPKEVLANRTYPLYNYRQLDYDFTEKYNANRVNDNDVTIVTSLLNIDRESIDNRNFEQHYLNGLARHMNTPHALIVHAEEKYFDTIKSMRGDLPLQLIPFNIETLKSQDFYDDVQNIIQNPVWVNQADWMKTSIISSPNYIPLTLMKTRMMKNAVDANVFNSKYFYWVDSGLFNSYGINLTLDQLDFSRVDKSGMYMMKYPYYNYSEIHGYSPNGYDEIVGFRPDYVCRACFFGGDAKSVTNLHNAFEKYLTMSLEKGYIGTEESIFTIIAAKDPEIVNPYLLLNGSINYHIEYLKK